MYPTTYFGRMASEFEGGPTFPLLLGALLTNHKDETRFEPSPFGDLGDGSRNNGEL